MVRNHEKANVCMSWLWLGTGCDNGVGTASLSLRLTSQYGRADARTIVPTGESLTIHSYSIEGSGPNGKTFSITTQSAQVLIEGLVYGTWAIQATGLNEQGTELATGSTSHQLTPLPPKRDGLDIRYRHARHRLLGGTFLSSIVLTVHHAPRRSGRR